MASRLIFVLTLLVSSSLLLLKSWNTTKTLRKTPISSLSVADTNSLFLQDISGKNFTLDDIKKQHAGKAIFIEYWASWCGPCRELMPASEAVREEVKDLNVAYIYLSLDTDHAKWVKASGVEKIVTYLHNYRITNLKNSEFIKKYNLNFIPQAMVLGKSGMVLKTQLTAGDKTLIPYLADVSQN